MGRKRVQTIARSTVVLLALLTCGCATSDDTLGEFVVDRANYEVLRCPQLAASEAAFKKRAEELDKLMAKAATDTGGAVVNAIAYRPESITVHGSLNAVRKVQVEKHCPPPAVAPTPAAKPTPRKKPAH